MRIRAIAHYNCPVTYITYIMTGQPVEETPMASTVPRKRRKALTKQHWAKMQPYIKEYYINQDLTLEETMQRISSEHEFEATEQMYKKRLKAWGFTKQIKADDKEKVLAKILHGEPVTEDMAAVRIDKVLRYARSRIKCGALSDQYLSKISKRYIAVPCARPANVDVPSVPRSPDYPGRFAQFDVFLRAMQAIIERERGEYFSGYQSAPDTIFCALTRGMALWHRNDFAAARISFAQAANNTMEDLRRPKVSVSRIAYCISSILWGKERAPVFQRFAEFLVKAATEVLGPGCPLTVVLKYIRHEQSIDSQVTIWESALAGYAATEGNLDHWWNMAQRRWQWCWRSGKLDLAGQFCSQALIEARQISRFTAEMEAGALHDLDLIMLQEKS